MKSNRAIVKSILLSIVIAAVLAMAFPSGRVLAQETTGENPEQFVSMCLSNL